MIKIETKDGAIVTIDGDNKPKLELKELKPQLEWSPTLRGGELVNFCRAEEVVVQLGDGWRLPTREELQSIVDTSSYEPAIDTNKFSYTESLAYWTSTPCAWDDNHRWFVDFSLGYIGSIHPSTGLACVRAVREVKYD